MKNAVLRVHGFLTSNAIFPPTRILEDTQPGGECFAPCRRDTGTSMGKRAASWAGFGKVQWAQESAKIVEIRSQNTNSMKSRKLLQSDSRVVKCLPGWSGDARGSPTGDLEFPRRRQYFSRLPTSSFEFSKSELAAASVGTK